MNAKRGGGDVKYCPPSQRRRCHRSTRGQSRSNAADTTRQRAGHQRGLLHSDSTTERNRGARGTTSTGGGRVAAHAATPMPPVDAWAIEQRSRHHPSTCGPSTRTPPQRHHDRTQCRRQGDDERGGGARGHLRRNAAHTTRQRAGHQRGVEKY